MMLIRLVLGELEGIPVVIMQGRFHSYEGYDLWQVCYLKRNVHEIIGKVS
jgi:purine-nucleoside phosphorylase